MKSTHPSVPATADPPDSRRGSSEGEEKASEDRLGEFAGTDAGSEFPEEPKSPPEATKGDIPQISGGIRGDDAGEALRPAATAPAATKRNIFEDRLKNKLASSAPEDRLAGGGVNGPGVAAATAPATAKRNIFEGRLKNKLASSAPEDRLAGGGESRK